MTTSPPVKQQPDLLSILACLLTGLALLLAVLLAELRSQQVTVLGELRLLSTEAQHALERPSLLDVRHFARLSSIGERLVQLAQAAERWPIDQLGRDRQAIQEAAQGLLVLGGQGKAFGELSLLLEKLRWEGEPPSRQNTPALQGLCGDDATIADMPRLRSVLGDRLRQPPTADEGTSADSEKGINRGADRRMQQALALIDEFRGLRSQSLALLEESASRTPHPLLIAGERALLAVALLGLLAAVLRWWQRWRAVRRIGAELPSPPPLQVPPAEVAPDVGQPWSLEPVPTPAALAVSGDERPAALAAPSPWLDLRHAARAAVRLSTALGQRASGLMDAVSGDDTPADESLVELLLLATPLARAREATVNLALALLSEDADPVRVQALERLDQLLVAILSSLRAHADQRGRGDAPSEPSSLVPRRSLVALQAEIGHLSSQLASLAADIDSVDAGMPVAHASALA